ncbi:hypothetical protein J6590_084113, partial [Homalodisca vitripennis]
MISKKVCDSIRYKMLNKEEDLQTVGQFSILSVDPKSSSLLHWTKKHERTVYQ